MLTRPSVFKFDQSTPSTTWVINHNLSGNGSEGIPIVDVFINYNGEVQKVIPGSVLMNNKNQCTVTFSAPQSGYAIVIA